MKSTAPKISMPGRRDERLDEDRRPRPGGPRRGGRSGARRWCRTASSPSASRATTRSRSASPRVPVAVPSAATRSFAPAAWPSTTRRQRHRRRSLADGRRQQVVRANRSPSSGSTKRWIVPAAGEADGEGLVVAVAEGVHGPLARLAIAARADLDDRALDAPARHRPDDLAVVGDRHRRAGQRGARSPRGRRRGRWRPCGPAGGRQRRGRRGAHARPSTSARSRERVDGVALDELVDVRAARRPSPGRAGA